LVAGEYLHLKGFIFVAETFLFFIPMVGSESSYSIMALIPLTSTVQ